MPLRTALRVPSAYERVEFWHVSVLVDLSAYAFGWLWILIPVMLMGPLREDYLACYLLTICVTDLHRHFGLPLVYLDDEVRRRYPARFWLLPTILLVAWLASPSLDHSTAELSMPAVLAIVAVLVVLVQVLRRDGGDAAVPIPVLARVLGGGLAAALILQVWTHSFGLGLDGAWGYFAAALLAATYFDVERLRASEPEPSESEQAIASAGGPRHGTSMVISSLLGLALWAEYVELDTTMPAPQLLTIVGVFAGLWNFWHVYMQKYGILRMYAAKARATASSEVPGPIDRALVLCWLPLYFAYLGPLYREIAVDYFDDAAAVLPSLLDVLEQAMPLTIPLAIALVVVSHLAWLHHEWRAHRLRNAPRLLMALGTSALAICFFVFDPVKVYLAFAFSHSIEYCVFVWAWQRKRYHRALAHDPPLGRLLRRPLLFYLGMVLLFGVSLLLLKYWGRFIVPEAPRPELFGHRTAYWLGFWGIYQSLVHFYFDGFLWKMRLPSVRANI